MNGAELFLDLLANSGVRHLFGNPGSTELPLMDALAGDDRLRYYLALQEVPVMAMADGYAQATRRPAVVNLHASCGVGNAMGMLYNSWCAGTPLLVTAGQQDRRLLASEPVLAGDTVAVTRPWTKFSAEVTRAEDLAPALRKALQAALTPPTGPVFLSLPVDLQSEEIAAPDTAPPQVAGYDAQPAAAALEEAARVLTAAQRPAILAGSRVTEYGATRELAELAERLGAPVICESQTSRGRLPLAPDHPLYAGTLPLWSPEIRKQLSPYDVALVVGMDFLRLYIHHEPACPIPKRLKLVQLDIDARQVAKNFPVAAGLTGDLRTSLAELRRLVGVGQNWEQARRAVEQRDEAAERRAATQRQLREQLEAAAAERPMSPEALIGALARVLPGDAAVIDEAPTTGGSLLAELGVLRDASGHFGHRGWALGWGLGAALGVKLAWPGRPVVALLGDGAALYGIQGLWTAAHYRIPVVFLIANNSQYRILKDCGAGIMKLPRMSRGEFVGMDITEPAVDYVQLAASFGVEAHRVEDPAEVSDRVRAGLAGDQPLLLDVPLTR